LNYVFHPPRQESDRCHPLTCSRPINRVPVANRALAETLEELVAAAVAKNNSGSDLVLNVYQDSWLSLRLLTELSSMERSAKAIDEYGSILAWLDVPEGEKPGSGGGLITADQDSFKISFPWDLLRINEHLIGQLAESEIEGDISPNANIEGRVRIGPGTRILPGVFIEGNAVIGADCKIGPNCYIRGATAIGDGCHIGQAVEVKNSILMNGVGMGHLSYCGDSILGENVNFGAGTITANLRHDKSNHRSWVKGALVDTGRRKFGTVVGDNVHTGIHTSIYPGRKLWPGTSTRPGEIVSQDVMD